VNQRGQNKNSGVEWGEGAKQKFKAQKPYLSKLEIHYKGYSAK
jgi:hypothetical protein